MAALVRFPLPSVKLTEIDALPIIGGKDDVSYTKWRSVMWSSLNLLRLRDVLELEVPEPQEGEQEVMPLEGEDLERFRAKDRLLFDVLQRRVQGIVYRLPLEADGSGRGLWRLLQGHYAGEVAVHTERLLRERDALVWPVHETAASFSLRFARVMADLSELGYEELFEDTRRKLLVLLPRTRYGHVFGEVRKLDSLREFFQRLRVHDEEFHNPASASERGDVVAVAEFAAPARERGRDRGVFSSRGRGRGGPRFSSREFTGVCDHCKLRGHKWRNCPKLEASMRPRGGAANVTEAFPEDRASVVVHVTGDVAECVLATVAAIPDPWCVDSGASMCMTPVKSDFRSLEMFERGRKRVAVADAGYIDVAGAGMVKIRARTATGDVANIEMYAFYVPDLRLRLLSTGECADATPCVEFTQGRAGGRLSCPDEGWTVPLRRGGKLAWLDPVDVVATAALVEMEDVAMPVLRVRSAGTASRGSVGMPSPLSVTASPTDLDGRVASPRTLTPLHPPALVGPASVHAVPPPVPFPHPHVVVHPQVVLAPVSVPVAPVVVPVPSVGATSLAPVVHASLLETVGQSVPTTRELMHERMGHPGDRVLASALGVPLSSVAHPGVCVPCAVGKAKHPAVARATADEAPLRPGSIIACDIMGPVSVPTINGALFALAFVDRATRMIFGPYLLAKKSDAVAMLSKFALDAPQITAQAVRLGVGCVLQCDNDGVFRGQAFREVCVKLGLTMRCSAPYLPAMNGLIERVWGDLMPRVRALLVGGCLPQEFWGLAMRHAVYLHNVLPHTALAGKSPIEAATGVAPDMSRLRVFGSLVFAVIPVSKRDKVSPVSRPGVWVGVEPLNRCARVCLAPSRTIIEVFDPIVDETAAVRGGAFRSTHAADALYPEEEVVSVAVELGVTPVDVAPTLSVSDGGGDPLADPVPVLVAEAFEAALAAIPDGPVRGRRVPDPLTVQEALAGPDAAEWLAALLAEGATQKRNRTWDYVLEADVPLDAQILRSLVALRTKYGQDDEILKRKIRFCVQGCSQRAADIGETFAGVARFDSVRVGTALAASLGMILVHADVISAFLNAPLPQPRYMRVPPGLPNVDAEGRPLVCRVLRALNGFAESPRLFADFLAAAMGRLGFKRTEADPCVFVRAPAAGASLMFAIVWVDDILAAAYTRAEADAFFTALSVDMPLVNNGPVSWYLGMAVTRGADTVTLSQAAYVQTLATRVAGDAPLKPCDTPMEAGQVLVAAVLGDTMADVARFRALVGALLYVSVCTRPDVAYAVNQLARHMSRPSQMHWEAAVRVVRYLVTTSGLGLVYRVGVSPVLVAYADASFASDEASRRSVGGTVFLLAGAAVSWRSRVQSVVALSSTEAEYIAMCDTAQDAVYLRRLCAALMGVAVPSVKLCEDNQPAIAIASDATLSKRASRHVQVKYHFVRQCVADGTIVLEYVPTAQMVADAMTKALARPQFRILRAAMLGAP